MKSVTVVCTTFHEEKTVLQLLEALTSQTYQKFEIIICDGGSEDKTAELVAAYSKKNKSNSIQLIEKKGNRSVGRNAAIAAAKTDLIAITDAGCIPKNNWLEELLRVQAKTEAPVVAGYYVGKAKTRFEEAVIPYVLVMPDKVNPEHFLPATRSMLLEKKVWEELGGFDETLSLNEDYPFAKKLKAAGYKITFAKDAVVEWMPRKNILEFMSMVYRFAQGDVQAGIVRPKVAFLFVRYLGLVLLLFLMLSYASFKQTVALLLTLFVLYSIWAIEKNIKFAPRAWYWLPVLQYTADGAVMLGSLAGLKKKLVN